ncbi:invasion associated locus B family protein [Pseudochelatococcus contaminans]|uniref:Invasion protein IalB n=1 Tax=Pseudochelatococcus contaminans TaxID=1538103 RepID=A0A7W6EDZ1_9HYPH|nr:invasion associated locus B family protein [Pseudochelatococcus contaminans]MBB3807964.1 invasion protein IalB [Pseudochelatococcus contaminans]
MIRLTPTRALAGVFAASVLAIALPAGPAQAQAPAGSVLAGTFSDWSVYTSQQGGAKVCYAVTQPKVRLPAGLNRDPAYLFVSSRPKENVRNEISFVMGFPTRPGQDAQATVNGGATFALVTSGANVWVKDAAQENAVLAAMRGGSKLTVKSTSARGSSLTDEYSLAGVSAALQRLARECP